MDEQNTNGAAPMPVEEAPAEATVAPEATEAAAA